MTENKNNFIMRPTVDFCFKELMQNEKVRTGFIATLLKVSPKVIKNTILLPTIFLKEREDSKFGILDVRVKLTDGMEIDMEMQTLCFQGWIERTIFYLSKMFSEQLKGGDSYHRMKKCIHVSILDYVQFPEVEEFYNCFHIWDDEKHLKYTDKLEIHVLELPKLAKCKIHNDDILTWAKFLNGKTREEFENMAKTNEYLNAAYETLVKASADETKRLEYEARERAIRDYNSLMEGALEYGIEEGIKEGIEKGIKEGIEKGMKEGIKTGENSFAVLTKSLLEASRTDDLLRAVSDERYREELYKEFDIKAGE